MVHNQAINESAYIDCVCYHSLPLYYPQLVLFLVSHPFQSAWFLYGTVYQLILPYLLLHPLNLD